MYYIRMVFYIGQPSLCAIKKHACIHVFTHTYWYIHAAGRYRSIQADLQPGAPSPLQQRCSKFCIGRALVAFSHIACIGSTLWAFPNCKVTSVVKPRAPNPSLACPIAHLHFPLSFPSLRLPPSRPCSSHPSPPTDPSAANARARHGYARAEPALPFCPAIAPSAAVADPVPVRCWGPPGPVSASEAGPSGSLLSYAASVSCPARAEPQRPASPASPSRTVSTRGDLCPPCLPQPNWRRLRPQALHAMHAGGGRWATPGGKRKL